MRSFRSGGEIFGSLIVVVRYSALLCMYYLGVRRLFASPIENVTSLKIYHSKKYVMIESAMRRKRRNVLDILRIYSKIRQ